MFRKNGAPEEIRTPNLLIRSQNKISENQTTCPTIHGSYPYHESTAYTPSWTAALSMTFEILIAIIGFIAVLALIFTAPDIGTYDEDGNDEEVSDVR